MCKYYFILLMYKMSSWKKLKYKVKRWWSSMSFMNMPTSYI